MPFVEARWVPGEPRYAAPAAGSAPSATVLAAQAGSTYALQFDGTSTVDVPRIPWGKLDEFTIEAWVRSDESTPGTGFVFDRYNSASLNRYQGRWQFTVKIAGVDVPIYASHKSPTPPGKWEHLAGVVKNKVMTLYVDGKPIKATPITAELESAFGDRLTFGRNLQFTLREVRVSKTARYTANFDPPSRHEPDGDTLALYHLDDGNGTVARDSSAGGLDGQISGAKWVLADGTSVK
jgi:hypothetical protein